MNNNYTFTNRKGNVVTIEFDEVISHSFSGGDTSTCLVKLTDDRHITFTDSQATEFADQYMSYLSMKHAEHEVTKPTDLDDL